MTVLACGSCAFDHIMVFQGRFRDSILPDQLHALNVSFLADDKRMEFGGCAGNIAYSLNLLGVDVLPQAAVGVDFGNYAKHFDAAGICRDQIKVLDDEHTASAFIITDLDGNQVTVFHAGAMHRSHQVDIRVGADIGILSPEGREGMLLHARQMKDAGIPFIFDPGQGTPMFTADELIHLIDLADYLTCNEYEMELIMRKTDLTRAVIARRLQALVVTRGGQGSEIVAAGRHYTIPAAPIEALVDPTGCGDAYRAGLICGMIAQLDWEVTGQVASLMGAFTVEKNGTQNHAFTKAVFNERFERAFGCPSPLDA